MREQENRRYRMFGRVEGFGKDYAADFKPESDAAKHFVEVSRIIGELDEAKAKQRNGSTTAKEVLYDSLRIDLQNVVRTARAMAQDEPGFADRFRLPKSSGLTALITAVDATILELGKPGIVDKFIAHELPTELIDQLKEDRQAIAEAQDMHESENVAGVSSTASVGRLIREGMKEVTYLDAIMNNKYTRDPDKLRAWRSASLIERSPRRQKAAPAAAEAGPPRTVTAQS